jgi:hypothetical protein
MAKISQKQKNFSEQAIAKGKGDGAPVVIPENYRASLSSALAWYNINMENKQRTKVVLNYLKKNNHPNRDVFDIIPDYEFMTISSLIMIKESNGYLSTKDEESITERLNGLHDKYKNVKAEQPTEEKPKAPVIPIDQRIIESARAASEDIDYAIDSFIKNKTTNFSTKNHLLANNVSGPVSKKIAEYYKNTLDELNEAIEGTDEQLVEGYSFLSKTELKKFRDFIQSIVEDCNQLQVVVRKPRIQKAKPPAIVVKNLKYQREFEPLGLKSVSPADIVGCTELWVYNTKQRKLISYEGADGYSLTVKSSKIINFSTTKSQSRTLRDPLKFFKELDIGKRNLNNAAKAIKTKLSVPNGRMTEDIIILGAFK